MGNAVLIPGSVAAFTALYLACICTSPHDTTLTWVEEEVECARTRTHIHTRMHMHMLPVPSGQDDCNK